MGPMSGTLLRVGFEGDGASVREVSFAQGAMFALDLRPSDPRSTARLRVDVLRDNAVVAQGASPPIAWAAVSGQILRISVQPVDRVVSAPGGPMRSARADFALVDLGAEGVVAATIARGTGAAQPDEYFLPSHQQRQFSFAVDELFDGDTAVVRVPGAILLQREARVLLTTGNAAGGDPTVNAERRLLRAAGIARTTPEEVYLLGGKNAANSLSNRVDKVDRLGNISATSALLSTGRERAGVIRLRYSPSGAVAPVFFVFGGQDPQCPGCMATERWTPETTGTPLSFGPSVDRRVGFTATCVASSVVPDSDITRCTRVLVLGGADGTTGVLATEDVQLDGECILNGDSNCVRRSENLLTVRRRGLQAAVGRDGSRVVITGGTDAMDAPVYTVEVLGVSDLANIARLAQQELTVAHPASIALADGSVMIAGGLDRNTSLPSKNVWLLRGAAAALPAPTAR